MSPNDLFLEFWPEKAVVSSVFWQKMLIRQTISLRKCRICSAFLTRKCRKLVVGSRTSSSGISTRKPCFCVAFLAEIHGFGYRRMQVVMSSCQAFPPQNTNARAHFLAHLACFLKMTLLFSVGGIISGGQGPIVIVIAIVESTIALLPYRKLAKPLFFD